MPFFTNFFGKKAFIGNPVSNLQRFQIPEQTNITPVIKSIYPGSKLTGSRIVTIFLVNFAHKMRITRIMKANINPYRTLFVIPFDFPILQFHIMICHLIRNRNFRKGFYLKLHFCCSLKLIVNDIFMITKRVII